MEKPALEEISKIIKNGPVLFIDKQGTIAGEILSRLSEKRENLPTVFASQKRPKLKEVFIIPFRKKLPALPKYHYSLIVVVYNGEKEILQILPKFIKEAYKLNSKLVFITPLSLAHNLNVQANDLCVVLAGELFGDDISLANEVNDFFYQAKTNGKIKIAGSAMEKLHPVFFEDAVDGILRALNKKPGIYYLFPKHGITKLSFVRILQKIEPSLRVDFTSKKEQEDSLPLLYGKYLLEETYSIEKKVRQVFENWNPKDYRPVKVDVGDNSPRKKSHKRFAILLLSSLIAAFIMPLFLTLLFSSVGVFELKKTRDEIEKSQFLKAKDSANIATASFKIAKEAGIVFVFEANIINQKIIANSIVGNIEKGEEISQALLNILKASEDLVEIASGKSSRPKENFISSSNSLKNAIILFQKLKTEDNELLKNKIDSQKFDNLLKVISSTIDLFPDLLGFEGEKKYLVLFQNNMELRPGGGFVGSYGLLTINDGKVKNFSIHDVYDADGQLKGHIEPPFAIRRYIPLVHLYLRDSNFSVDFRKNASSSAFLLEQETGEKVDGVIGVDVNFVKNILSALGPTYVPDYNETVTAENLYTLTQSHAEKNFFPGSTQKKDFLRSLFNAMQESFSQKKDLPYLKIAESVGNSISQKHILLSSNNPAIQNVFTINGMSSSLWDNREEGESNINDFLGINEANLGINKANYFVKRKINQEVFISEEGIINEKVTLYYKNDSNDWPGGDYKTYLRLVLPKGAKIASITVDDKEQKMASAVTDFLKYERKDFKPPKELEVEEAEEEGKSVFGFLTIVPLKTIKKIAISYALSQKISPDIASFTYNQRLFKQPGTNEDFYAFSLSYPESFKTFRLSDGLKESKNQILYLIKLTTDRDFEVRFSRK